MLRLVSLTSSATGLFEHSLRYPTISSANDPSLDSPCRLVCRWFFETDTKGRHHLSGSVSRTAYRLQLDFIAVLRLRDRGTCSVRKIPWHLSLCKSKVLVAYRFMRWVIYIFIFFQYCELIVFHSGSLFIHKWLWFKTFLEYSDNPSTQTVFIHFICVWLVPFLLVVLWQPVSEADVAEFPKPFLDAIPLRVVKSSTPCQSPIGNGRLLRTRVTADSDFSAASGSMV